MKPLPSKEDWKKAKEILEDADKYDFSEDGLEEVIAQALADQREEDAQIAEEDLLGKIGGLAPAKERWDNSSSERAAKRIAAAIRKGKEES